MPSGIYVGPGSFSLSTSSPWLFTMAYLPLNFLMGWILCHRLLLHHQQVFIDWYCLKKKKGNWHLILSTQWSSFDDHNDIMSETIDVLVGQWRSEKYCLAHTCYPCNFLQTDSCHICGKIPCHVVNKMSIYCQFWVEIYQQDRALSSFSSSKFHSCHAGLDEDVVAWISYVKNQKL